MGARPRHSDATGIAVAHAKAPDAASAARAVADALPPGPFAMILVFLSPFYAPQDFLDALGPRFPGTPVHGCTTAGELAPHGWEDDSVVALAFSRDDFDVAARPLENLSTFRVDDGRRTCRDARQDLARSGHCDQGAQSFGLLLIDGLSRREEAVMSAVFASLDDIPVVGGSAGDGLRFEKAFVFCDGRACSDAAVLILVRTPLPFRLFKCDSFEPTDVKMVVTEADIERRIVKELNAEPAAQEYSRAVGVGSTPLDAFSFASHPVLVRVGGSHYARSIQRMNEDGSLSFFCAIDEGMVLTVAHPRNPVEATQEMIAQTREEIGDDPVYIGFECVLRRLDADQHQFSRAISDLYRENNIVGFHTYGEQFRSMHVNQTLTGVAIAPRRPAS